MGGFQLMQILGLLGMSFDAVVAEVKTFLLLFRLALTILCPLPFCRLLAIVKSAIFDS